MEFDGHISRVQGALVSLGSREILNNPDLISTAVSVLRESTHELPENAKQRVTFFMVLNTELKHLGLLRDDNLVGLFAGATPLIHKEYLIEYVYQLRLHPHLCRMVENCPAVLSDELIRVVIEKLKQPKFHKDEYGIEHLYRWLCSIFVKLFKIQKGSHGWDKGGTLLVTCFKEVYKLIETILITSMTVADDNLTHFLGSHLVHLFKSILSCISLLEQPCPEVVDDPVYELSIKLPCDISPLPDPMNQCIDSIFGSLDKVLENLTVDMWMSLAECHLDTNPASSVQVVVGNLVYEIDERVQGRNVPGNIRACFSALKMKPKTECDLIAEAGMSDILVHVDQGKAEWFRALVRHPGVAEEKPLACVIAHLDLATPEDVDLLLSTSLDYVRTHHEGTVLELMKRLVLALAKRTEGCSDLLEKVFQDYRPGLLENEQTKEELVETVNKISCERSLPMGELVSLCLQAPVETLRKLCHLAVCDANQTELCASVLKVLEPACRVAPERDGATLLDCVLLEQLRVLSEKERQAFVSLAVRLGKQKVLGVTFTKALLRLLQEELESSRLEAAVFCLEVLQSVLELETFAVDELVLLVLMSEVLDRLSWDAWTFSPVKADGKAVAASVVASTLRKLKETDGRRMEWALSEIGQRWQANQAHFRDLWLLRGREWPAGPGLHCHILGLVHARRKTDSLRRALREVYGKGDPRTSLILALITLLPVLTYPECRSVFSHLADVLREAQPGTSDAAARGQVLEAFGSALSFVTAILEGNGATYPCYEHCLRNFGRLVQAQTSSMGGKSAVGVLEQILSLLRAIEDRERRRACSLAVAPVLLDLVDRVEETDGLEAHRKDIRGLLAAVDVREVSEAVSRRLS